MILKTVYHMNLLDFRNFLLKFVLRNLFSHRVKSLKNNSCLSSHDAFCHLNTFKLTCYRFMELPMNFNVIILIQSLFQGLTTIQIQKFKFRGGKSAIAKSDRFK